CSPNPHAPAAASIPDENPVSTAPGAVASRKSKDKSNKELDQSRDGSRSGGVPNVVGVDRGFCNLNPGPTGGSSSGRRCHAIIHAIINVTRSATEEPRTVPRMADDGRVLGRQNAVKYRVLLSGEVAEWLKAAVC